MDVWAKFESAEFTANQGMTKVIQRLFKQPGDTGSRHRPDFVVLPESSVGLYASPSYDDLHEVDGIDHLAVIELKTTGRKIGGKDREQVWEYIRELDELGHLKPRTRVDGFVLGDSIAKGENRVTVYSDTVRIRPMLYETILERAEKRLLNLYDRIKGAPFMKDAAGSARAPVRASAA